jgi:hypothetical protein
MGFLLPKWSRPVDRTLHPYHGAHCLPAQTDPEPAIFAPESRLPAFLVGE